MGNSSNRRRGSEGAFVIGGPRIRFYNGFKRDKPCCSPTLIDK